MKKSIIILLGILLLTTISLALNINLQVTPTKSTFYDNESVSLDINITNYELSLAAQNAKVIVKINEKNISIPLGNIEPDKIIIKTLDLGKFDAGTYRLETYLEHEFLGITDRTQAQYQNIRVLPSIPIRMKTHSILVTTINIPEEITVNKEFTIEFDVNSSTDTGFVEFGIAGEKTETENLKEGIQTIKRTYKLDNEGSYLFEIKAYTKKNDVASLKDYKTRNFVVIDPSKYEKIEYKPIEKKKGNITIEVGKQPERNLIEEVGCFIIGGCKGDFIGPELRDIAMLKHGKDKYIFTLTADDTNSGNSKISGCYIRTEAFAWRAMNAEDESYDSNVEKATFELVTDTLIGEKNVEFECTDDQGNIGYSSYNGEFGCKNDNECDENEVCIDRKCEKAKLILAFVPINWESGWDKFDRKVDAEIEIFLRAYPLSKCPKKLKVIKVHENCVMMGPPVSKENPGGTIDLRKIENCAKRWTSFYDRVVGISDSQETMFGGFSCLYCTTAFVEGGDISKGTSITSHELGHTFGLLDEYCYSPAGSPNPTTEDLCSLNTCCSPLIKSMSEEGFDLYEYCRYHHDPPSSCRGNDALPGDKCIMGSGFSFCKYCLQHLNKNPKLVCE